MKIDGSNPIENKELFNKVKDLNKNQEAAKQDNANKSDDSRDRISLSGKAKEINELKSIISDLPDIRTDKVESLKQAIELGNYKIDSMKVAEKMLEET